MIQSFKGKEQQETIHVDINQLQAVNNNVVQIKPQHSNIRKYDTRDLSWLKFNKRILELAEDRNIPLLERIKFLSITSSNLDEFTMVRIPKLIDKIESDPDQLNIMGKTPKKEFDKLTKDIDNFIDIQNSVLESLLIELQAEGIFIIKNKKELTPKGKKFLKKYFEDKVLSLLTPLVFDNVRPFPLIANNTLYIGVIIDNNGENIFGTIQVPDIDRLIEIHDTSLPEGIREFILLEDLIRINLDQIFVNKKIEKTCIYRVLRDYDYKVDNDKVFLADEIKETLKRRQANDVLRLDISGNKKEFTKVLHKAIHISKNFINKTNSIIDPTFGFLLADIKLTDEQREKLLYKKFSPQIGFDVLDEYDIFDKIDKNDIVLHHPYESYDTVIEFVKRASEDKDVMAIKQTLYRVSKDSPIMKALIKAAENGKHVTVLLEIKARFDEENNLAWANRLERAGGHVIYGVPDMKTHCKMCLVIKKTKKGNLEKYVHIGTGNYNEKNAKQYTDISILTSNNSITNDIEKLFNYITGFSEPNMRRISYSPNNLFPNLVKYIDTEIEAIKAGKQANIVIKVNGLTDKAIIDKLYEASDAGVKIELIVRGSCGIYPTENISIKSIVGRFLEHSRIYYFKNTGVFISSADLMERNLYHRIELLMPVLNKLTKARIMNILKVYQSDNSCFINKGDEGYIKLNEGVSSQETFMEEAIDNNNVGNISKIFSRS